MPTLTTPPSTVGTITVMRLACCAADDQIGPLQLDLHIVQAETLAALIERIASRRFLQFSSSHSRLTGTAAGRPLVRIAPAGAEFLIPARTPVSACLPAGRLDFVWAEPDVGQP